MMGKLSWLMELLKDKSWGTRIELAKKFLSERKNVDDILKCALCPNICRYLCPLAVASGSETLSPSGRARIAWFIKAGYLEPAEDVVWPLFYCLGCDRCKVPCYFEFSIPNILRELRKSLYEQGKAPSFVYELVDKYRKHGSPFGDVPTLSPKSGEYLVILGHRVRKSGMYYAYGRVLEALKVSVAILENEPFRDKSFYDLGAIDMAQEQARTIAELINSVKPKAVIAVEPSSYRFLTEVVPELGFKLKAKVFSFLEFVAKRIPKGLKVSGEFVAHEPCQSEELAKAFRDVVNKLEGLCSVFLIRLL